MKTEKQTHMPMTVMGSDCDCKWTEAGDDVKYCPVHAAAPELLEALKHMSEVFERELGPKWESVTEARAAIAKAGGR